MATKSVIEIDVLDEKFQAFAKDFAKFRSSVEGLKKIDPLPWSQKMTKQVDAQIKGVKDLVTQLKNFEKISKDNLVVFKELSYTTANIARNLASGAVSIAKWATLGAIGGGFGLAGVAGSASDYRRQAQGLGVSTGQLRATETNFGRYFDPTQVLSNIADVKSDLARQSLIGRLGGSAGQNPVDLLPNIIRNAVKQFRAGGQTENYAKATGLTEIFNIQDLRRLSELKEDELNQAIAKNQQDAKELETTDAVNREWQDFLVQLKKVGQVLETSLIKTLEPLIPKLIEFSEAVGEMVKDFLTNLKVDELKEDITYFLDALKGMATIIENITGFFGLTQTKEEKEGTQKWERTKGAVRQFFGGESLAERNFNPGNLRYVGQAGATQGEGGFAKFASDREGFKALAEQLTLYATGKSKAAGYKKLDTIQDIISLYAPKNENDTKAYIKAVEQQTGRKATEHLNLQDPNVLSSLLAVISKVESGKSKYSANEIKVMITNNTGGNAVASAASLPNANKGS